jgi:hypothetical protein
LLNEMVVDRNRLDVSTTLTGMVLAGAAADTGDSGSTMSWQGATGTGSATGDFGSNLVRILSTFGNNLCRTPEAPEAMLSSGSAGPESMR